MSIPPRNRLEIRTPEGVTFALHLAGPFSRFLAWLLDVLLIYGVSISVFTFMTSTGAVLGGLGIAFAILFTFVLGFAYRIVLEWRFRGQTFGKRLLRLRVMDATGLRLQFNQVVLRNLIRVVDLMPFAYALGGAVMLINPRFQRLGDIAAGTIVVYQPTEIPPDFARVLSGKYNSFRDYPHLEARLRQQVSPEEASLLVNALLRREELEAQARVLLYRDLAEWFRGKTAFPEAATAGVTDEQYLRNVVDSVFRGRSTS